MVVVGMALELQLIWEKRGGFLTKRRFPLVAAAVGPAAGRRRNSASPTRNCWRSRSCCFHCCCCCRHLREIEMEKSGALDSVFLP